MPNISDDYIPDDEKGYKTKRCPICGRCVPEDESLEDHDCPDVDIDYDHSKPFIPGEFDDLG